MAFSEMYHYIRSLVLHPMLQGFKDVKDSDILKDVDL